MITTVTGKNQITSPAVIANRIGLKNGSRINWRISSTPLFNVGHSITLLILGFLNRADTEARLAHWKREG